MAIASARILFRAMAHGFRPQRAVALRVVALVCAAALGSATTAAAHPSDRAQIGAVDSLLAVHPDDPALLRWRAELSRLEGDFAAAERALAQAEALAPGDPRQRVLRARLRLDRGLPGQALEDANALVEAHPDDPAGWRLRAESRSRTGAHEAAARDLDGAIGRMGSPEPGLYLFRARETRAAGHEARALEGLEEARRRFGPLVSVEREAIELEMALGRSDAALRRLDALAGQYDRRDAFLLERGDLLYRSGRLPEALASWTEALSIVESRAPQLGRDGRRAAELRARLRSPGAAREARP